MAFGHFLGLSRFHGHGFWLVCEVALIAHINVVASDVETGAKNMPHS